MKDVSVVFIEVFDLCKDAKVNQNGILFSFKGIC